MVKARKVHDSLVPRRSEEIRGVVFTNKYAAGEGGGSEFFDLLQTPSSVYQICISSPSYLISSALLGILSQHRDKDFNPAAFLKEAAQEIETINSAKKKKSEADILVLEIDLNTLMLKSHGSPKAELYSQSKGRVNLSKDLPYQTAKGEKLIVLSSGFLFNWKEAIPEQDVFDFLKAQSKLSSSELMSELFFKLKEKGEERFLKRDATVVMMEVNRHGIHKV